MPEFYADFWVATAAGAPVIALAAVVQFGDAASSFGRANQRMYELVSDPSLASSLASSISKVIGTALVLDLLNIVIQAGVFIFSLIVLGQHNFSAPSAILLTIAITEGIGIVALLIATALSGSLLRIKVDPSVLRTKTNSDTSGESDSSSEPS